jgi:hypothetical protein
VIIAASVFGLVLLVAAWLALAGRRVHVSNLDAVALAAKIAVPHPESALDWPDLNVRAVVAQPDESLLLLHVIWPAHPAQAATLLVALDEGDHESLPLLTRWRDGGASVWPTRQPGAGLELRRKQSTERVHAQLLAEDNVPA